MLSANADIKGPILLSKLSLLGFSEKTLGQQRVLYFVVWIFNFTDVF